MYRYDYISKIINKILPDELTDKILSIIYPPQNNNLLLLNKIKGVFYPSDNNDIINTNLIVHCGINHTIQRCFICGHIMIVIIKKRNTMKIINFEKNDCECNKKYIFS